MVYDRILISIKRATPDRCTIEKALQGVQHCQICDFVLADQKLVDTLNNNENACKEHLSAYQVVQLPLKMEPLIRQYMQPAYDRDGNVIMGRMAWADETELCKLLGITSADLVDGRKRTIVDGSQWKLDDGILVKRYDVDGTYTARDTIDLAAWTAGIASIKSDGTGNYLTGAAYSADLGVQSAAVTGRYDSAITETAQIYFNNNNGTYDTTLTSSSDPLGNPNAGFLVSINHASGLASIHIGIDGAGGNFYASKLNIKHIYATAAARLFLMYSMTNAHTCTFFNNVINLNGVVQDAIQLFDTDALGKIYCNKFYGIGNGYAVTCASGCATGTIIENNTVYSATTNSKGFAGISSGPTITFRNNIAIVASYAFTAIVAAVNIGINNYSSGTTGENADFGGGGSGNITSGDASVFQSTDPTSALFLKPVKDSAVDGAGATPTLSSVDIAAVVWAVPPAIGCHEVPSVGGTKSRQSEIVGVVSGFCGTKSHQGRVNGVKKGIY